MHHSSATIKNEIAKNMVKSMEEQNSKPALLSLILNQTIIKFDKEFRLGNLKISVKTHDDTKGEVKNE